MEESKAETKITTVYSLYNTLATNVIEYNVLVNKKLQQNFRCQQRFYHHSTVTHLAPINMQMISNITNIQHMVCPLINI
jgi:hypothetical protein